MHLIQHLSYYKLLTMTIFTNIPPKANKERMYRLLTDILMSKTIQFSLLEFPIFHNLKSADKVVRFISSFIFYDTFLLKVIAQAKSFTRNDEHLLIRSESTSHIQLIFHALIRRKKTCSNFSPCMII